ncbi:MAG TPA: DPP IV N-terminal domain-containing protein [Actinopolymorphaceae bacterium]|nr:DPP IV N-terminal domain-containing protein [Actinopolymorphaceae bacterium]
MTDQTVESPTVTSRDYARAEGFLPWHVRGRLFGTGIQPRWSGDGDRFTYDVTTREGKRFVAVDPDARTREVSDSPIEPEPAPEDGAGVASPDGHRVAFVRDGDLWVRDATSGVETALTSDGDETCPYATVLPSPLVAAGLLPAGSKPPDRPAVLWAPDSRRLLTHRLDTRGAGELTLVQSAPPDGAVRPKRFTYAYPLPGDEVVPTATLMIVDVDEGTVTPLDLPPAELLYYGTPLPTDPDAPGGRSIWWHPDGSRCYVLRSGRGNLTLTLWECDAATGAGRMLVEESGDTPADPSLTVSGAANVRVLADGAQVLWYSHRDGWGHLYLHEPGSGAVRQVTSGAWAVEDVLHVDEAARVAYVTGLGREPDRNPYDRLVYRVPLDGGEPTLLTPDDGSHLVTMAPSGRYFVTTWARVDSAPVTDLRSIEGSQVMTLETVDVDDLTEAGWTFPERFTAPARDGRTQITGVMIRPTTFDPRRRYPVIDAIYAGPQTNQAPASFAEITQQRGAGFWQAQALAELGFVVVMIDGLGMPYRSKAFRDVSYKNLADAGLPDHIAALRHLATTRPYLDLDRVGIYGHSAGGYASCQAMLAHPDFYKVCVSSAGNHDHRQDKAWWVERYMGWPVGDHYRDQANRTRAHELAGKLLLIHGEMDENVHVASTLALVDALVAANKDFDLLVLPNRTHACGSDPYVVRRRWDYFVRHLAGGDPPSYRITPDAESSGP